MINIPNLMNDLILLYMDRGQLNLSESADEALVGLYFVSVNQCEVINWFYHDAFNKVKDAVIKELAFRYVKKVQDEN